MLPDFSNDPILVGIDIALSDSKGDYTVFIACRVKGPDEPLLVIDQWKARVSPDKLRSKLEEWDELHRPEAFLIEDDNASRTFVSQQDAALRDRIKFIKIRSRDKETRAASLRRMFREKLVYLLDAPWKPGLEEELLGFPAAPHDDSIDALSCVANFLPDMGSGFGASSRHLLWDDPDPYAQSHGMHGVLCLVEGNTLYAIAGYETQPHYQTYERKLVIAGDLIKSNYDSQDLETFALRMECGRVSFLQVSSAQAAPIRGVYSLPIPRVPEKEAQNAVRTAVEAGSLLFLERDGEPAARNAFYAFNLGGTMAGLLAQFVANPLILHSGMGRQKKIDVIGSVQDWPH